MSTRRVRGSRVLPRWEQVPRKGWPARDNRPIATLGLEPTDFEELGVDFTNEEDDLDQFRLAVLRLIDPGFLVALVRYERSPESGTLLVAEHDVEPSNALAEFLEAFELSSANVRWQAREAGDSPPSIRPEAYPRSKRSPTAPRSLGVFISHSSQDGDVVSSVARQAEAMGVNVYIAEHDVRPGKQLAAKVKEMIQASDAMVVLLTQHGLSAPYVQQEIGFALGLNKPVIPLLDESLSMQGVAMLEGVEYLRFDPRAPQNAFTSFTAALTDLTETLRGEEIRQHQAEHEAQQRQQAILVLGLVALLLILAIASRQ